MVIKVIDEISNKKGIGIIEANKIRMKKIQDNIKDFNLVDNLFVDLEVSILKGDIDGLKNVISKKLYFEEIDGKKVRKYSKKFFEYENWDEFLEDCKIDKQMFLTLHKN